MSKIGLIIHREFITRVRKRSFLIMTILGPVLSAALFILPAYLATLPEDDKVIIVLDEPGLLDFDQGKDNLKFNYLPPRSFDFSKARDFFESSGHYGLLYIPSGETFNPDYISRNIKLYTKGNVGFETESYIEDILEKYIQQEKLKVRGVDPEIIAQTKSSVSLKTYNIKEGEEKESQTLIKMGIAYIAGFLIYIFVFMYGAQVMRGVIEEKTSRIVEVMISSVKPFQLMMGKILGLALVALLQFLIWVIFGLALYVIATTFILGDAMDTTTLSQMENVPSDQEMIFSIMQAVESINFPLILGSFLFFFIFGYLLYAAMFAAIGSAVDKESDTQQFMFPVSLPLVASLLVILRALSNPDGPIAFWFSIIPFTSPIVMMARVPFGVPVWEMALSMFLLVGFFLLITWIAGRIYRTGILMYGKKPTLKELFKWMKYRS